MPSVRDIPRIWCCHFEQALILVICLHKRALPTKKNWHQLECMFFLCHFLRASPPVLSLWLQRVKFIVQKSKCASLAQEIGFSASTSCILLCLEQGPTQLCTPKKECNKLDLTAAEYSWLVDHNDWSRWFAINSSHVYAVLVTVLLAGFAKKKNS
jgi:hypothetical protein